MMYIRILFICDTYYFCLVLLHLYFTARDRFSMLNNINCLYIVSEMLLDGFTDFYQTDHVDHHSFSYRNLQF